MSRRDGQTVRLEELFHPQEPAPAEPRRRPLVRAALLALGASLVLYVGLYMSDFVLPYPLVLALCVGAALVREAVRLLGEPSWLRTGDLVAPVQVRRRLEPGDWYEGGDGMARAVRHWERALSWGEADKDRFANTVSQRLGVLVDERLRQYHGITRASDPARARELVGDRVWTVLEPRDRVPSPGQILAALNDLDRLNDSPDQSERKDPQ